MVNYESEADYLHLIGQCPSEEWRESMMIRYNNWKDKNNKDKKISLAE